MEKRDLLFVDVDAHKIRKALPYPKWMTPKLENINIKIYILDTTNKVPAWRPAT